MDRGPAIVTAVLKNGDHTFTSAASMSTDLPAEALGELVAEVLQKAWRSGLDPVNSTVFLNFS